MVSFACGRWIGGFFATVWQLQCDLAWHPQWLLLPGHNSNHPCHLCETHKSDLYQITRARKPHIMTPDQWRNRFTGCARTVALWEVTGLTGLHCSPDLMHCKWLGTDAYLLGSALAVLFKFKYNQDLDNLLDDLSRLLFCRFSCACCSKVAVGCSEFLATPTCWDGLMF